MNEVIRLTAGRGQVKWILGHTEWTGLHHQRGRGEGRGKGQREPGGAASLENGVPEGVGDSPGRRGELATKLSLFGVHRLAETWLRAVLKAEVSPSG